MNILVLDEDPVKCAEYHADRDVSRKILEYAELMTMAHVLLDGKQTAESRIGRLMPYGGRKFHHCMAATWVRSASGNYNWLHKVTSELLIQFEQRFKHVNVLYEEIYALRLLPFNIPSGMRTRFVFSVPANCRRGANAVAAYRTYYCTRYHEPEWRPPAQTPEWFEPARQEEETP